MNFALTLSIALLATLVSCKTDRRADGGQVQVVRETFDPQTGKVTKREEARYTQQQDPETGSGMSVTFGDDQIGLQANFGSSFFRAEPIDHKGIKFMVAGFGLLAVGLGGFGFYRGHARLGSIGVLTGLLMIAVVFTIESYGAYYAAGVALMAAAAAWLAWSSYRSGQEDS